MKVLDSIPSGLAPAEPWPAHPRIEVRTARSNDVLVPVGTPVRFWELDPFSGCEFACVFCRDRQEVPFRDADPRLFERDIHVRVNAVEAVARALKSGVLAQAPLVLGLRCDPWQPCEEKAKITRRTLEVLARSNGAHIHCQTRSVLVTRDTDLFLLLGKGWRVTVCFSLPTVDFKLARFLEPLAPSPDRRLIALEALARAGVAVGVQVAPVLSGLNEGPAILEGLLRRARDAGASFASVLPLSMDKDACEKMVRFVARFDLERANRYHGIVARHFARASEFDASLETTFAAVCERLGLAHRKAASGEGGQRQLSLFRDTF